MIIRFATAFLGVFLLGSPLVAQAGDSMAAAEAWTVSVPVLVGDTIVRAEASAPPASFDLRIARGFRSSSYQRNPVARAVAGVLRSVAIPGTLLLAGAVYGTGYAADDPGLSDLGVDTGEAIVAAGVVSLATKIAVGRARPSTSPLDSRDLQFGRGIQGDAYQSFPSAHTAAAFATATVLAAELSDHHPGRAVWLIPLMSGGAALTGISRLYHDEHWATDVIGGAVVGILSGWIVAERGTDR